MNNWVIKSVLIPIIGAICGVIILIIPIIGPLIFLPLMYLAGLYDYIIPGEFIKNSNHVDFGLLWITLKTWQAWIFYTSLFFFIGIIITIIKNLTRGRITLFLISLLLVFGLLFWLSGLIRSHEKKQELLKFITPTETLFACDNYSSFNVKEDGSVWKFEQDKIGKSQKLVGYVDFDSNNFIFYSEQAEEYSQDLNSCLNITGDSIANIYNIEIKNIK